MLAKIGTPNQMLLARNLSAIPYQVKPRFWQLVDGIAFLCRGGFTDTTTCGPRGWFDAQLEGMNLEDSMLKCGRHELGRHE